MTSSSKEIKEILEGERIRVSSQGFTRSGIVQSAKNYGRAGQSDWYIEFLSDDGPCYWKEGIDGGTVEILEAHEIIPWKATTNGMPITTVLARSRFEARRKVIDALDRPGRYQALMAWDDGGRVVVPQK